jgi:hypothetical protein
MSEPDTHESLQMIVGSINALAADALEGFNRLCEAVESSGRMTAMELGGVARALDRIADALHNANELAR